MIKSTIRLYNHMVYWAFSKKKKRNGGLGELFSKLAPRKIMLSAHNVQLELYCTSKGRESGTQSKSNWTVNLRVEINEGRRQKSFISSTRNTHSQVKGGSISWAGLEDPTVGHSSVMDYVPSSEAVYMLKREQSSKTHP